MPIAVKAYEWFRPLLSQTLQERVHLVSPKHSDGYLSGIAPPSALPLCYGGELAAFPSESCAALGYERVDAARRAMWFRGPQAHLGHFYIPEDVSVPVPDEAVAQAMPVTEAVTEAVPAGEGTPAGTSG